jgi:hypothetical protein
MLMLQSPLEFHINSEIERTLKSTRKMFKSKTNPNQEQLDPNFVQISCSSNKTSLEEDHSNKTANKKITQLICQMTGIYRSIKEYALFDPSTLQTSKVRPYITTAQFEFKHVMFHMLIYTRNSSHK